MVTDLDVGGGDAAQLYRHPLVLSISRVLGSLASTSDPSSRQVRWTPLLSGVAAVLMALETGRALLERFADAQDCLGEVVPVTYNGLMKALARQAEVTQPVLMQDLRRQALKLMEKAGGSRWLLLAVDGTKVDVPRTRSNERHFGIADNGREPHVFLTTIVHAASGLVWDWRLGEAAASEKHDLMTMIAGLPERALLLCDGNFVGHPIWSALLERGVHFIARVGANVRLLTDLYPDAHVDRRAGIVWVWPNRWRTAPPLRLRLVKVGSGDKRVYLLTSVLDPTQLSRKEIGELYRRRWGIETFYRSLKRTLDVHKLRSASGGRAALELWWAVVALATAALLAVPAILRARGDPTRVSPAQVLRILRRALRTGRAELAARLATALVDDYQRTRPKRSRHRPTTRNTPQRPRAPKIISATPAMRKAAANWSPLMLVA